mgnify:CR=1 FL=1
MAEQPNIPVAPGPPKPTYWQRLRTLRDRPSRWEAVGVGLLGILLALLIWHVLTMGPVEERTLSPAKLPSVSETFRTLPTLWFDRALARSAVASLSRVLGGFALATAIALPLGVLAGCYLRLDAFLLPYSVFGRNVPIAALVPLSLIWFGLGETQKVMFIVMAAVAFILFDTVSRIRGVSDRFLDTAYTLGAKPKLRDGAMSALIPAAIYGVIMALTFSWLQEGNTLTAALATSSFWSLFIIGAVLGYLLWLPILGHQVISKVLLPLALPHIVNSLRLLFGIAFGYIMLAEVINAGSGLGNLINISQRQGPREHIYLCLMIIALLAFAIDRLALWLQHRLFPYANHVQS